MRVSDRYECAFCGAAGNIPKLREPNMGIIPAANGSPAVCVLTYDGVEIHRCTLARTKTR